MEIKKTIKMADVQNLPIQVSAIFANEFSTLLHKLIEHKVSDFKHFGFLEIVKYGTASYKLIACLESAFNEVYADLRVHYLEGCDFNCFKTKSLTDKYKTICSALDLEPNYKAIYKLNDFRNNSLHFYPVLTAYEASKIDSLDINTLISCAESANTIVTQISDELNKLEFFNAKDIYAKSIPHYLSLHLGAKEMQIAA